ncbi:MAG: uroporphyrinogen-III synthase [Alphaproteobacteria bacterium]|nr:uroporphyrinogen-III synthase [Alphaproteobacteria bacterium]
MKRTILITRPEEDARILAEMVAARGYHPLIEPLLSIRPLPDTPLPPLRDYQALVFTSPRAVRVFAAMTDLRIHPAYAVGVKTAAALRKAGWAEEMIKTPSESKGVEGLESLLREESLGGDTPLLHPCGVDIAAPLSVPGLVVTPCPVYKAAMASTVTAACRAAIDRDEIAAALFYSARTAKSFVSLLGTYDNPGAVRGIKALCISDSVLKSLDMLPWKDVQVAHTPDGEGMRNLLDCICAQPEDKTS